MESRLGAGFFWRVGSGSATLSTYLAGGVESLPYDEVDNTPGDYMTVFRLDPVPSFHLLGWIPIFLAGSRLG